MVGNAELELYDVEYDAIRKENGPVNEPSHHTVKRDLVLAEWGKKRIGPMYIHFGKE